MIKEAIEKIVSKQDLTYDEAYTVMNRDHERRDDTQVQNAATRALSRRRHESRDHR